MKTVGEILRKARQEKNLDFETIERRTKIRKKYLEALEKNDWGKLHSPTYIKGFLRNYSNFLGLKAEEMVAIFRRQYTEVEKSKVLPDNMAEPLEEPLLRITPQKIVFLATFIFLFLFVFYLVSQYRAFTGAPELSVISPKEGEVFNKNTITISGITDKDAQLFINNQKVEVDDKGAFKQDIVVNPGVNTLSIESQSKLGKKTKVTRTIQIENP